MLTSYMIDIFAQLLLKSSLPTYNDNVLVLLPILCKDVRIKELYLLSPAYRVPVISTFFAYLGSSLLK